MFITTDEKRFPKADIVSAPAFKEVWKNLNGSHQKIWREIDQGTLWARGNDKSSEEDEQIEEILTLDALCQYCGYSRLCGKQFEVNNG